jgi:hypothetical protein
MTLHGLDELIRQGSNFSDNACWVEARVEEAESDTCRQNADRGEFQRDARFRIQLNPVSTKMRVMANDLNT